MVEVAKWRDIFLKVTILLLEIYICFFKLNYDYGRKNTESISYLSRFEKDQTFFGLVLDLIFSDLTCIMIIVDGSSILRH